MTCPSWSSAQGSCSERSGEFSELLASHDVSDLVGLYHDDVSEAALIAETLGRTLKQCSADVLAYFNRPGTSNGPTEAINGRLEHLRGSALGFRNLTNYIARCLLEAGGSRPRLHRQL